MIISELHNVSSLVGFAELIQILYDFKILQSTEDLILTFHSSGSVSLAPLSSGSLTISSNFRFGF